MARDGTFTFSVQEVSCAGGLNQYTDLPCTLLGMLNQSMERLGVPLLLEVTEIPPLPTSTTSSSSSSSSSSSFTSPKMLSWGSSTSPSRMPQLRCHSGCSTCSGVQREQWVQGNR